MLRLPSPDPAWADLARGVRVLHRPASSAEVAAADAWSRGELARAAAQLAERLPGAELAETDRRNLQAGHMVIALGRLCVSDWSGVADQGGAPLPCSPAGVAALLAMPDMAAAYLPLALGLETALAAEGNGSAPAPTGTTAGAPDTAPLA